MLQSNPGNSISGTRLACCRQAATMSPFASRTSRIGSRHHLQLHCDLLSDLHIKHSMAQTTEVTEVTSGVRLLWYGQRQCSAKPDLPLQTDPRAQPKPIAITVPHAEPSCAKRGKQQTSPPTPPHSTHRTLLAQEFSAAADALLHLSYQSPPR